jgi:hypothetical protein
MAREDEYDYLFKGKIFNILYIKIIIYYIFSGAYW